MNLSHTVLRKTDRGATASEIVLIIGMVIVLILGLLLGLNRAKTSSNEITASRLCKGIWTSQKKFQIEHRRYADSFLDLQGYGFLEALEIREGKPSEGHLGGYVFQMVMQTQQNGNTDSNWEVRALPVVYGKTGRRSFYIDNAGCLRGGDLAGQAACVTHEILD
jgi:competence protein ComGC